jgi:3-hydroxybutyryl-CoA dehydrogenase
LVDVSKKLTKGISTISKNLDRIIAKGNLTEEQKAETLGNISTLHNFLMLAEMLNLL